MARVALEVLLHGWYLIVRPCEIIPDAYNGEIELHLELTYIPQCGDTVYLLGRAYNVVNATELDVWEVRRNLR